MTLSLSPGREDFGAADGAAQVAHGAVAGVAGFFLLHMERVQGQQDPQETHEKPHYPLPARGGHSQDGRRHFFPAFARARSASPASTVGRATWKSVRTCHNVEGVANGVGLGEGVA